MRIIKISAIRSYYQRHSNARPWLQQWVVIARQAGWHSLVDVRRVYPHADAVLLPSGNLVTVFNVMKNRYRLIVAIHYNTQRIYLRDFMTHAEYSKNHWKLRH